MSKKSGAIILTATATITLFAAAAVIFLRPGKGEDTFSAEVLERARTRQNYSVASVPQPLETDLEVLSDEQRMAEKVAAILNEDEAFLGVIGDKSAEYVGEKISDLEEIYSSDMIQRIDETTGAALAEAKNYASDLSSAVEFSSKSYADETAATAETNAKSFASAKATEAETYAKNYTDKSTATAEAFAKSYTDKSVATTEANAKAYAESVATSNEDLVQYLLANEDFLNALSAAIVLRTGKTLDMEEIIQAIVDSSKVQETIESAILAYHSANPVSATKPATASAIPLPSFDVQSSETYTEEEYKNERSNARYNEIDKILDFLGY